MNPPACRRVLWILLVRSCAVGFVFVWFRLSPWRGFFASSSLNPPLALLNTGLVLHTLLPFRWLFPFFLWVLPSFCSVASYIQCLIHWLLCRTPFTRITFLNMAFSKAVLNMASSKTPGLHTCFGLNLNRGLNKTNVFCVQNIFYTKSCFTQKTVFSTNTMFYTKTKTMFLLGLCKGCLQPTG